MPHFQFVVLVCGGVGTILGAIAIITGAIVKKNSNEIKASCATKFDNFHKELKEIDGGARDRSTRIAVLESRYAEILSRITRIELAQDENTKSNAKNAEMTAKIYAYMSAGIDGGNGWDHKNKND
jgi:hypothetical protein